MDDRRFDSLVKALAEGKSRRSVFKGLLGLGGAAIVGTTVVESDTDAAVRPTPTPKPVKCPGQQVPVNGVCTCPTSAPQKCGPSCCNPAGVGSAHTECCDRSCCNGKCYGEEQCCPYNRTFCEASGECCPVDKPHCCGAAGCCATPCCETTNGLACCEGDTPKCCPNDYCVAEGSCCTAADCGSGDCWSCVENVCITNQELCTGCLECVGGTCTPNNANCPVTDPCTTSTCNADGSCATPVPNCQLPGCGCLPYDSCYTATCNPQTGECEQINACKSTCCNDNNPDYGCLWNYRCAGPDVPKTPGVTVQIGVCYYDVYCNDNCCNGYYSPNATCDTDKNICVV